MNKKPMTPEHELWETFCERLEGEEGCNFQEDDKGKIMWHCGGGRDKTLSTAILESIPNIDIKGSLEYFDNNGGHCDCEILFNCA